MSTPRDHELIALWAIDRLDDDEAAEAESRFAADPALRREAESLRAVAALPRPPDVGADQDEAPSLTPSHLPPAHLRFRVGAAVAAEQFSWRRRVPVLAAAAGLVLLTVVGVAVLRPAAEPTTFGLGDVEPIEMVTAVPVDDLEAAVVAHTWGTELLLEVQGLPAGVAYQVTVEGRNGEAVDAGTFIGVDNIRIVCAMNGAILREDATVISVTGEQGEPVMRAALASSDTTG